MDFSIVTASYNYGKYIGRCLESVAAQSGVTFEHLIIDGGSSDDTAEVVAKFPHATFLQAPDKGMSDAINKGFRLAQGDWVMWLNADDFFAPDALVAVKNFVAKRDACDVVYGRYNMVDSMGELIRPMWLLPFSKFISVHHCCYVPSTATFYRRSSTIAQGFLLDERLHLCMDNDYYFRLHRAGKKFVYFPKILANFRIHDSNLSSIGGMKRDTLGDELAYAKKFAEAEAIKRHYGITLFKRSEFNYPVDFALYLLAWALKGLLKIYSALFIRP